MYSRTKIIRGVDACLNGWLAISQDVIGGGLAANVFPSDARALLSEETAVTAIDIPIGLSAAGLRKCDAAARRLVGARRSSVFPAPARELLSASSYAAACAASKEACGKAVSQQTYAILEKIRNVDLLLRESPSLLASVREIHPEVCFYFWNDRKPMRYSKKSGFGFQERYRLVEKVFGTAVVEIRDVIPSRDASDDDILDAFAALWTAQRIYDGTAERISSVHECDEFGLPMQMWA
jgi:predicted RNase H-like nuclease